MFLSPEIISLAILDAITALFATVAFIVALGIAKSWDINQTTSYQYSLEKQAYLGSVIIKYILGLKILLFLFYIFTLDKISFVLPGAMCAAGVVNADPITTPLLFLKVLNLYLFFYWIVIDKEDSEDEKQPYTQKKFQFFILLYLLLMVEIFLELYTLFGIDVKSIVDCCGAIFSDKDGSYIAQVLEMPKELLLSLFYGSFFLMWLAKGIKNKYLFSVSNLLFLLIALISLIAFFGTYIYELPSHHCPFCLLQEDYYYIGYLLYALLFLGTFYGMLIGVFSLKKEREESSYKYSLIFNTLYTVIVSYYPIHYFYMNGVWL
jgi:hypothetical protein